MGSGMIFAKCRHIEQHTYTHAHSIITSILCYRKSKCFLSFRSVNVTERMRIMCSSVEHICADFHILHHLRLLNLRHQLYLICTFFFCLSHTLLTHTHEPINRFAALSVCHKNRIVFHSKAFKLC